MTPFILKILCKHFNIDLQGLIDNETKNIISRARSSLPTTAEQGQIEYFKDPDYGWTKFYFINQEWVLMCNTDGSPFTVDKQYEDFQNARFKELINHE